MAPDLKKHRQKARHKSDSRERKKKHGIAAQYVESTKFPVKAQDHKKNVSDLVYQYLGDLAKVNERRKQRRDARSIFRRNHVRKRPRDLHPDRHNMMDMSSEPILPSNLKLNTPTYLPLTYDTTFSQFSRLPASREIVNDYAKAVDEGRNIARKYVCKALSFGVHSGFLVPADSKGQLLRVSSNLCLFQTEQNKKRKKIFKKLRYDPVCLKNITKKLTNSRIRKRALKPPRATRLRQVKKKIKKRKARK